MILEMLMLTKISLEILEIILIQNIMAEVNKVSLVYIYIYILLLYNLNLFYSSSSCFKLNNYLKKKLLVYYIYFIYRSKTYYSIFL